MSTEIGRAVDKALEAMEKAGLATDDTDFAYTGHIPYLQNALHSALEWAHHNGKSTTDLSAAILALNETLRGREPCDNNPDTPCAYCDMLVNKEKEPQPSRISEVDTDGEFRSFYRQGYSPVLTWADVIWALPERGEDWFDSYNYVVLPVGTGGLKDAGTFDRIITLEMAKEVGYNTIDGAYNDATSPFNPAF